MSNMQAGSITALVLAGGHATRMGGIDKGLQHFNGKPLALHALQRLQSTPGSLLAACAVNANRHHGVYTQWGYPIWPDTLPDHPGPLAGMLTGLRRCTTSHLLTLPCDAPEFPLDLVTRLAQGLEQNDARCAIACAPDESGVMRRQPVFALLHSSLADRLEAFVLGGGRKVGQWMAEQHAVDVVFNLPVDHPDAFTNINTLDQLNAWEARNGSA